VTRAHTRRHDQNVVACADAPVGTSVTAESGALVDREVIRWCGVQILRKLANDRNIVRHIVVRDLIAALDAERGPDRLAKLSDELSPRDISRGEAMSGRRHATHFHERAVRQLDLETGKRLLFNDRDVVVCAYNDGVLADRCFYVKHVICEEKPQLSTHH